MNITVDKTLSDNIDHGMKALPTPILLASPEIFQHPPQQVWLFQLLVLASSTTILDFVLDRLRTDLERLWARRVVRLD